MIKINGTVLALCCFLLSGCSMNNQINQQTQDEARKFASAGKYKVLASATSERLVYTFTCDCKEKFAIILQSISNSKDQPKLCLSADHWT